MGLWGPAGEQQGTTKLLAGETGRLSDILVAIVPQAARVETALPPSERCFLVMRAPNELGVGITGYLTI